MFPHFDSGRLAPIRDFFPARDLVGNGFDTWGERFVSGATVAGVEGGEPVQESGHISQVTGNGDGLERAAKNVIAGSQMGSVEGQLPITTQLTNMLEIEVVGQI
jgi:hypothetical protein